jgi:RES domain-containing protein
MPRGWRIVKAAHAAASFDGEGARLYGGRWNSPGTALVYTAESEALAALELLVHLRAPQLLASYVAIPADFDDALVEVLPATILPSGWRRFPAPLALQRIGDRWAAEGRSAVLRVPSAVVPRESNYMLNPAHGAFARVAVGRPAPFEFDGRLR